jgi:hypothetical protein
VLVERVVGDWFSTARLSLGLGWAGAELGADVGYSRVFVPVGGWQIEGSSASASGTFGPFVGEVVFDEVIVADTTGVLERVPLGGTVTIDVAERTTWAQGVTLTFSRRPAGG